MNGIWRIAARLFWRDFRQGELFTLTGALILAIGTISASGFLSDRLENTLNQRSGEILGADLIVRGRNEIDSEWIQEASRLGLRHCQTLEFTSMLVEGESTLLVSVKAVGEGYPLKGRLRSSSGTLTETSEMGDIPAPGGAWVDPAVITRLNLQLGASVAIGEKPLIITRLLLQEPDRRNDFSSLSPRVLMHRDDVTATGIIQPGSQILFADLFVGPSDALRSFKTFIARKLRADQKLSDLQEDRPEISRTFQKTRQLVGFITLAILLMAGVSIAMSSRDYLLRHTLLVGLLRSIGSGNGDMMRLLVFQFIAIGIFAGLAGNLLGFVLQALLVHHFEGILPPLLSGSSWTSGGVSFLIGIALLAVFALPPILDFKDQTGLANGNRQGSSPSKRRFLFYVLGVLVAAGTLSWHIGNTELMLATLGAGLATLIALILGAYFILRLLQTGSTTLPFSFRMGIRRLFRHPGKTLIQVTGFTLTFACLTLVMSFRNDLIDDWAMHLPANAPNHFIINLLDRDLDSFRKSVTDNAPQEINLYPVIRGRLISINGESALSRAQGNPRAEGAINRDLALTYSTRLPDDNQIVAGSWGFRTQNNEEASVEEGLAKKLGIQLGDQLVFDILGERISTRVQSLRSVHWDHLTPNFFFILPKSLLDSFPRTWMTSIYIPPTSSALNPLLVKTFPSISVIAINQMIEKVREVAVSISKGILPLLILSLAAGFLTLVAGVYSSRQDRQREDRLLRILGASNFSLRMTQMAEFMTLGAIAGIYGVGLSEAVRWALYTQFLEIPFSVNRDVLWMIPLTGIMSLTIVGLWASGSPKVADSIRESAI